MSILINMKYLYMHRWALPVLLAFISLTSLADVRLPQIFQNGMVVQRNATINVWGWALPGEAVTVTLNAQSTRATADTRGKWLVKLPAMEAGGPFEMTIKGVNTIVLSDVLIGEVWICGGQSNMQWRVDQTGYEEKDTLFLKK